jgi:hypothetical protein
MSVRVLTLLVFLIGLSVNAAADQLSGIKEFADGDPAVAAEVNTNNMVLSDKAQELESRVLLLENTSDRLVRINPDSAGRLSPEAIANQATGTEGKLVELYGGKLILEDIDCNADPYAMNKLYVENSRFSYIHFAIKGNCYGDIARTTLGEPAPEGTFPYLQEHSQTISIGAVWGENDQPLPAKIIPNADSGLVGLYASFGGALYINNVDIELGTRPNGRGEQILYSRGATGTLQNLTITLPAGSTGGGVHVQHAASPYIAWVDIVGDPSDPADYGLSVMNNGVVYQYGTINISGVKFGLYATSGASIFTYGEVMNIESTQESIWIESAKVKQGRYNDMTTIMNLDGDIWIREQGELKAGAVKLSDSTKIRIDSGFVNMLPLNSAGDPLSSEELNEVVTCNGLSNASFGYYNYVDNGDGTQSSNYVQIPNQKCFDTFQWSQFVNQALNPSP